MSASEEKDVPTVTYCENCEFEPRESSPYCPECGEEEPWQERPEYEFDPDDLPFAFPYRVYDDNYRLWRQFCKEYFGVSELKGSDIANIPDGFPEMDFLETEVWWVVTEDLELKGPFLSMNEAREEIKDE